MSFRNMNVLGYSKNICDVLYGFQRAHARDYMIKTGTSNCYDRRGGETTQIESERASKRK